MLARITYRFPGNDVVKREGLLESIPNLEKVEGFIMSTFPGDRFFVLNEQKIEKEFNSTINATPVVLSKSEYLEIANEFLAELREKGVGKAVLSRVKKVSFEEEKTISFFNHLCETYASSFVYLLESEEFGTWIGASPEVLLDCAKGYCRTISLAGTISADGTQGWTDKEKIEQRLVTDDIVHVLDYNGAKEISISDVEEVKAGPVHHLRTNIRFEFTGNCASLASKLQPTPAVSGYPRQAALQLITRHERHERNLYAGTIGEVQEEGCLIYVNLRCARILGGNMYLFLGGGFTDGSSVEKEWLETENKSRTLLNIAEML